MRCPSCNTWVEEDAATCWMCQRVIRPDLAPEGGAGFDPDLAAAAPRRNRSVVGTLIIVFGVLIIAAGAAFTILYFLDTGGMEIVDEYVAGDRGVEYASDDGLFAATYPTEPSERDLDWEIEVEQGGIVESEPGSSYRFSVSWGQIPVSLPAEFVNEVARTVASDIDGEIEAINQRELAYAPATEMVVANDDETHWVLAFEAQSREYLVEVVSSNDERAPFEHFVSSLRLTGPSTDTQP